MRSNVVAGLVADDGFEARATAQQDFDAAKIGEGRSQIDGAGRFRARDGSFDALKSAGG